jgi:hypothetical protein
MVSKFDLGCLAIRALGYEINGFKYCIVNNLMTITLEHGFPWFWDAKLDQTKSNIWHDHLH